jgi:SWI/SNF-related matrix-associated actin-dependent regulator of chromatin subfamily A member 5
VQNNLKDTYSLLYFLSPTIFETSVPFEKCFNLENTTVEVDRKKLFHAHYMLRPFILRRVKSEVEQKLPPKLETLIKCPVSEMQRFWTKGLLIKESKALNNLFYNNNNNNNIENQILNNNSNNENSNNVLNNNNNFFNNNNNNDNNESNNDIEVHTTTLKKLVGLIFQLRKAAIHPYLFDGAEKFNNRQNENENDDENFDRRNDVANEEIVTASGKMMILDRLLEKLFENGHRVVLFSQFTRVLDIISDYLDLRGYIHTRLDGSTHRVMREVLINQFNKPKSDIFIFCLSTRAGFYLFIYFFF